MLKKISVVLTVLVLAACQTASDTKAVKNPIPVTVEANCAQRADDGYRDKITASVNNNVVSALDWTASPRAGSCRFQLKDFKPIANKHNVDLQSKKDKKCHLYIWQDERHITVSVYNCKKICAQNDRILPVLLEPTTGACKPAGNDK